MAGFSSLSNALGDLETGSRLTEKEPSKEKKHKNKKHKRHVSRGSEAAEMAEQALAVDQEQEMDRKKNKKSKHRAEDCGVSAEMKEEERKSTQMGQRKEAFEQQEHILKKTKSSCDQSELVVESEAVASADAGVTVSMAEEQTLQEILQKRKKKKKREKHRDQTELSTQCETEDATQSSQQEEEIPQKKKMMMTEKKNHSSDQTEWSIIGETEYSAESSQQEEEIPRKKKKKKKKEIREYSAESSQQEEETPQKKKQKKKRMKERENHSSDQTEVSILGEIKYGTESSQQEQGILQGMQRKKRKNRESCGRQTESLVLGETEADSETSKPQDEIAQQIPQGILRDKKRKSSSGQRDLSSQSEIEVDDESTLLGEEIPQAKNRKRSRMNNSCDQSESSGHAETGTSVEDGSTCRQVGILKQAPLGSTGVKNESGGKSADREELSLMHEAVVQTVAFKEEVLELTLGLEQLEDCMQYIEELKEFIPDVEKRPALSVAHLIKYDLQRFRDFKKEGVSLKRGKYSKAEVDMLMKNVEDFLALTGIDSASKLFYPARFPEEKTHILKMKQEYKFYLRISDGICRPWHDIYGKGRRLFSIGKMGRFTDEEIHSLQKLHQLHGTNWTKISELTGRSSIALEKRYSQMSANKGLWTEDEQQRLEEAVRARLTMLAEPGAEGPTIRRDQLYNNLPWVEVASKVGTRSWDRMSILRKKMKEGMRKSSGGSKLADRIALIRALYALEIEDVAFVNWEDLTKIFGDVTPYYVQTVFHRLKVKWVPRWQVLSFGEIIDFLYERALPQLEEQLSIQKKKPMQGTNSQQQSFLLSQIFSDVTIAEAQ